MKSYLVVSAMGQDRPGFVNRMAHEIAAAGGNIELQRSVRMAGDFASLFLVSVDAAAKYPAAARLSAMGEGGDLTVSVRDAVAAERIPGAMAGELIASGADHPGIIDAVTLVLYRNHVNIEAMDYDVDSAPMTGESLFRMNAQVAVPAHADRAALKRELQQVEQDLNMDILFRPLPPPA
jgi:glycine cleavage system regulatory protein